MKERTADRSSTSFVNICTFFTFLVIVVTFGTFSILQWKEIIRLNERVLKLEEDKFVLVHKRHLIARDTTDDIATNCCAGLAKPYIPLTSSGTNIDVIKGTAVTIPCQPSGSPEARVQWTPSLDPRVLGRYIQTTGGLLINSAQFTDSGNFTCRASNVFGAVERTYQLTVTDPVQVSLTPSSSQLSAHQNVDLVCSYNGVPPPVVNWYHIDHNNQRVPVPSGITASGQQSILHLNNVGALSAGGYICEVSNAYDKKEVISTISVTSKPDIIDGPNNAIVNLGNTVTLHCGVVSNPPANITWTFPKTGTIPPKTATIHPDGSVTLFHVDSFNDGDYTCTATNAIGSTSVTGQLRVIIPFSVTATPHRKEIQAGESFLQLSCSTSSGGQISWSKANGQSLTSNPGKYLQVGDGLIITSVDVTTDTGVYMCNGTHGSQKASDKVILYKGVQIDCSTTFQDCGLTRGTCGGTCPSGCSGGNISGYLRYTVASHVCEAALHAGAMNSNNKVTWTINPSSSTFESKLSNGILSQSSGVALQEAVFWK